MSKKKMIGVLIVAAIVVSISVAVGWVYLTPRPVETLTIKSGGAVLADYGVNGAIWVAKEKGFFNKAGVEVEHKIFAGGPDMIKALIAGDIQFGVASVDALIAQGEGAPIVIIAALVENNHFTLNVRPEINNLNELKGSAIGVTRPGSTTWVFANLLAQREGWTVDRDVKIVSLGGLDAQVAALERGEIKAFVWGDQGSVLHVKGRSKILLTMDKVTPKWYGEVIITTKDYIQKNPEAIKRFLKGVFLATNWMKDNPDETARIVAKYLDTTADEQVLAVKGTRFSLNGAIDPEVIKEMYKIALEFKMLKPFDVEKSFTTEFVPVKP